MAAKYGSKIWTTGQGQVSFIGNKSGYGKTIVIQHNHQYKTLYAHLSKFAPGLKLGSKVKQGEVIGYVGTTGVSTGPHVHYEFRINNKPVNPLSLKITSKNNLGKQDKEQLNLTMVSNNSIRTKFVEANRDL